MDADAAPMQLLAGYSGTKDVRLCANVSVHRRALRPALRSQKVISSWCHLEIFLLAHCKEPSLVPLFLC
jgi:hypothetical protein